MPDELRRWEEEMDKHTRNLQMMRRRMIITGMLEKTSWEMEDRKKDVWRRVMESFGSIIGQQTQRKTRGLMKRQRIKTKKNPINQKERAQVSE